MAARKILKLAGDLDPWERQPGESPVMYARFKLYMEMGQKDPEADPTIPAPPRSLRQLLEILNATGDEKVKSVDSLKQYAAKFRWVERAEASDAKLWETERRKIIKRRREAMERHRKAGIALQGKGTVALQAIPAQGLSGTEIVRMITDGVKLELAALGEPTATVAHVGPTGGALEIHQTDTTTWSPEQRRAYFRDIVTEMAQRTGLDLSDDADDQVV